MMVHTSLPADHPVSKLAVQLDRVIVKQGVSEGVAVCALLSLFTTVVKTLKRDDAAACLHGMHDAATQIAAVHFPEWRLDLPSRSH